MAALHFLNGKLVKEEELVISVRDLGFARGYAVFDFLVTYPTRRPFMLSQHIDRLFNSAEYIGLLLPWTKIQVAAWVHETLLANKDENEKAIKISISGGVSHSLLPVADSPTIAITVDDRVDPPSKYYEHGVGAILVPYTRYTPEAKTNHYIEGVKQAQRAREMGAIEPIYYDETQVFEGSVSNVFAVIEGKLLTPKSNILGGITRDVLLEILTLPIPIEVKDFSVKELRSASEVFFTGSNKEVMPITSIDGKPVESGEVGKITKEAMRQFKAFTLSDKWK